MATVLATDGAREQAIEQSLAALIGKEEAKKALRNDVVVDQGNTEDAVWM